MGDREQHEIIGKTVMELGHTKRKLAALEAKARSYAASMRAVAQELHPISQRHTKESVERLLAEPSSSSGGIESYPNRADVAELITELRETEAKVRELAESLRKMGVEPDA